MDEPVVHPEVSVRNVFEGLQQEMYASLRANRESVPHAPEMGGATELHWREWLEEYLPRRYRVIKGFVIDSDDRMSEQIDAIIIDRHYSPFLYARNEVYYVPAESVYAVLEVKQELDKHNITYAGDKIASVRGLHRTAASVMTIDGPRTGQPRKILGGIATLGSSWRPPFGEPFKRALAELGAQQKIDIGCALEHGAFELKDDGLHVCRLSSDALIYFFMRLFAKLQELGTVPPMDVERYSRQIETDCL